MAEERILIIDDDPTIRLLLSDRLRANGFHAIQASNGMLGLESVKTESPDMVLLDLQMPEMDGMEVLAHLKKNSPLLPVVVLTAHGTIEHAVAAMKLGAVDFLPKPCKPDHILILVKKALAQKDLKEENQFLREEIQCRYKMIAGESTAMKKVMEMVRQIAKSDSTVLLGGESGTGKQLLAWAIYSMSSRKNRPFIQVNCTTLSEQLLESDLFGHEKGAFTGASKQKMGRFELAHRGTLFLDEIGDLPPVIQAKLLHVLEYGEFQRVGGVDTKQVNVRIIAATNRDLQVQVREGHFREDLFYRLNVVKILLPPLRERKEDIPVLAEHFLKKHNQAMQKRMKTFAPGTLERIMSYSWPGNIRELENVIERAVVLATGDTLNSDLLPPLVDDASPGEINVGVPLEKAQMDFKKQYIIKTLQFTDNNQTKAAEILKIQRTYLNRLIKELGISI